MDVYNERQLVISEFEIYNMKQGLIKRKINIADLGGISKAMLGSKEEFTLHVPSEYDIRMSSPDRRIIVKIL